MQQTRSSAACYSSAIALIIALLSAAFCGSAASAAEKSPTPTWDDIPVVKLHGGLKIFWNINAWDRDTTEPQAVAHGFELVDLLNTYSDYPGKQREKIVPDGKNPWNKPAFFKRIIRQNVNTMRGKSIFVNDIEFHFKENIDELWNDPAIRTASQTTSKEAFRVAYYKEWASWYALPCIWAKEKYPNTPVGIYGPQPFRRDYWGIAGKDAQQIDGTHKTDAELWKHIASAVDFCIASVYCFYDYPGSVYYMASNIEENHRRMQAYGNKPVYVYIWLRYHNSNAKLIGQELDDYLVEAAAVLPFFTGARGLVLWGHEPDGKGPYYHNLPLFMKSLARLTALSEKIAQAELVSDEPVHVAWKEKRPLICKLRVSDTEWIVLAANPWQTETDEKVITTHCGNAVVQLTIRGKHTEIYHVVEGQAKRIEMGIW